MYLCEETWDEDKAIGDEGDWKNKNKSEGEWIKKMNLEEFENKNRMLKICVRWSRDQNKIITLLFQRTSLLRQRFYSKWHVKNRILCFQSEKGCVMSICHWITTSICFFSSYLLHKKLRIYQLGAYSKYTQEEMNTALCKFYLFSSILSTERESHLKIDAVKPAYIAANKAIYSKCLCFMFRHFELNSLCYHFELNVYKLVGVVGNISRWISYSFCAYNLKRYL